MNDTVNDDDIYFLAEFTDGYCFRNLIEYLRHSNVEGNFVFSKEEISYEQRDGKNILFNSCKIKTCKLSKYIYKIPDGNTLYVGLNMVDIQTQTKNIGKKDGCRIYFKNNRDPNLYIQIISSNKGNRSNIHFVRTKPVTDEATGEMPDYDNDHPNAITGLGDFAKTCKILGTTKCDYVIIRGYEKGITMSASVEGKLIGRVETFGECFNTNKNKELPDISHIFSSLGVEIDEVPTGMRNRKTKICIKEGHEIPTVKVPSDIIKNLGKLNNTSANGVISFYLQKKGQPWKISAHIGFIGTLDILIRDSS